MLCIFKYYRLAFITRNQWFKNIFKNLLLMPKLRSLPLNILPSLAFPNSDFLAFSLPTVFAFHTST